jgi:hypothetical protein
MGQFGGAKSLGNLVVALGAVVALAGVGLALVLSHVAAPGSAGLLAFLSVVGGLCAGALLACAGYAVLLLVSVRESQESAVEGPPPRATPVL